MSGGKSKSSGGQKSSETLDPQIKGALLSNYGQAQSLANKPYQPYTGERVAGFNDTQVQAQGLLKDIGAGLSDLGGAKTAANGLAQFAPQQATGAGYGATQASAAQVDRGGVQNLTAGQLKDTDLSAYMNPYEDAVVGTTLADQERARQISLVNDRNRASASNAFGGDRHAVLESLTNEANDRNTGSLVAQLRMAGYDKATGNATNDINRTFAADQANQGVDLSVSGQNATLAQQAALANQDASNTAAQFGAAASNTASLANQQADITGAGVRREGASLLAGLSEQQLADQLKRATAMSTAGDAQQQHAQAINDAQFEEFQRQLAYAIQMQQIKNESLGLLGNPTLTDSSGWNKSTSTNLSLMPG